MPGLTMDVDYEKTGPCFGTLSVTISATAVDKAFSAAYKSVAKIARIPGFRPGKAPRRVLDMHYGSQVRDDVENQLVRQSLTEAMAQKEVAPVATPRIAAGTLKKGADFSYTAELEIQPEIELKKYKGLKVPVLQAAVDDKDVDAELEKLRQQSVQLVPVLDRDVVAAGDLVLVDYEGTIGGIALEGARAEGAIIEIGSADYLPGLSDALLGAKVPGDRNVPIDFPDDYPVEKWRGNKATFAIKLKELKKKDLPALDDDFAQDVGQETLAALRAKITGDLRERKEQEDQAEVRKKLLESLVEENPFEVPPSMVAEQGDRMIIDAATRVRQLMGPQFDIKQLDIDNLRKENKDLAEFNVRSGMLLLEVAKVTGIEVSPQDTDAEITKLAEAAGEQAAAVRAHYHKPEERNRLTYSLLERKTIDYLLDNTAGRPGRPSPKELAAEAKTKAGNEPEGAASGRVTRKKAAKKTNTKKE